MARPTRCYNPTLGRMFAHDPLSSAAPGWSGYRGMFNNPVSITDPTGMYEEASDGYSTVSQTSGGYWSVKMEIKNPIFDTDGNLIGNTKEGFTGDVLVYSGDKEIDFSSMSASEALKIDGVETYDSQRGSLSNASKSNIWTNIASHFEGTEIEGKKFSLDNLEGKKIHFEEDLKAGWKTKFRIDSEDEWGHIRGEDLYKYESTVENLASSIIVHEWYSHAIQKKGAYANNHSGAFDNVINKNPFWRKTTPGYKSFNLRGLAYYKKLEARKLRDN